MAAVAGYCMIKYTVRFVRLQQDREPKKAPQFNTQFPWGARGPHLGGGFHGRAPCAVHTRQKQGTLDPFPPMAKYKNSDSELQSH